MSNTGSNHQPCFIIIMIQLSVFQTLTWVGISQIYIVSSFQLTGDAGTASICMSLPTLQKARLLLVPTDVIAASSPCLSQRMVTLTFII